jgi:choline dehydrogenase-like flavoprotein
MADDVPAAPLDDTALERLADLVVPASEHAPSASAAGAATFLRRVLAERPDWAEDVIRLAAAGDPESDPAWPWFARLVNGGFWGDPGNGGNRDAASWQAIGWRPEPRGGWSRPVPVPEALPAVVSPAGLAPRYDAIVIGSGAGGGVAAAGLAESGRTVLVVEAGSWPSIASLAHDHLRNPRSDWGLLPRSGPVQLGLPRRIETADGERLIEATSMAYRNNAFTAGGGTRVYGAQAWRFTPDDLAMASRYGVPEGSALDDWPIGWDELEPFYVRAEWEVGVSGDDGDGAHAGPRSRPRPMGPVAPGARTGGLAAAAERLGLAAVRVPLLINSEPYLGRAACEQCAQCIGFACLVDAKNGSQNTLLPRAFATERCSILLEARVERLLTGPDGRVRAVAIVGETDGALWRAEVAAEEFVLAAGAEESPRILLNSATEREPAGLGNAADMVGRHLQGHLYTGANAVFDDAVDDLIGPGPSIALTEFRHGNPGVVGGGIIVDDFVPTPSLQYRYLVDSGLIPASGAGTMEGMRRLGGRIVQLRGPIQEVTSAEARVRVDPSVRDRFGVPIARLTGSLHPEDQRASAYLAERAAEWMREAGATQVAALSFGLPAGPSGGQHGAGSLRMGTDPARSAVDPWGRLWGHDNVRVADGSVHVTNGGVNPVLTILATAFRTIDHMVGGWPAPSSPTLAGSPAT